MIRNVGSGFSRTFPVTLALVIAVSPVAADVIVGRNTPHLSFTASLSPDVARPGGRLSLVVNVIPKKRMHVYTPGTKYRAVTVKLNSQAFLKASPVAYPKPSVYIFKPLKELVLVYSDPFKLTMNIAVGAVPPRTATPEDHRYFVISGVRRPRVLPAGVRTAGMDSGGSALTGARRGRRTRVNTEPRGARRRTEIFFLVLTLPASTPVTPHKNRSLLKNTDISSGVLFADFWDVLVDAPFNRITGEIIAAAIEVHRILGPGLLESVYMPCLQYSSRPAN